jgi:SOS-response transcriptional repressor LexA
LKRRGREIVLMPENSAFEPMVVNDAHTDMSIEGVAVGLLRTGAFK